MLSLIGTGAILITTPLGIGASPDSVTYLGAAHNLLAGRGLTVPFGAVLEGPLTQFPPLYPLLLASLGLAGTDPTTAARWLAALLFGLNIALVGFVAQRSSQRPAWLSIAAAVMLISPSMLRLHVMAWSEPLFLCLGFAGLLQVARYLEHGRWPALLAASGLIALACLTRYAGLAFLATALLALTLARAKPLGRRLGSGLSLALFGGAPLAAWSGHNLLATGAATTRALALHPIGPAHVRQALDTASSWLLVPVQAAAIIKLAAVLALFGGLATAAYWHQRAARRTVSPLPVSTGAAWPPALQLMALFIPVYALFLAASISLVDANTPLDDRILAPIYVAGLCLVVFLAGSVWHRLQSRRWLQLVLTPLALVFAGLSLVQSAGLVVASYRQGIGFNSVAWHQSETLTLLRDLPAGTTIYSNAPEAVWLHTGRSAYRIPRQFNVSQQAANPGYAAELARMASRLAAGGVVVYFDAVHSSSRPTEAELVTALSLNAVAVAADGSVYDPRLSERAPLLP